MPFHFGNTPIPRIKWHCQNDTLSIREVKPIKIDILYSSALGSHTIIDQE